MATTHSTTHKARRGLRARLTGSKKASSSIARTAELAAERVIELEARSDDELSTLAAELRAVAAADGVDAVTVDGLALAAVLADRHLGMRPYRVQLMGAAALLSGSIAQMATGEGKTLVAMLAAFTFALEGRGCHVITPNDYLAARDAASATPMFEAVGATVGCVTDDMVGAAARRVQHAASVTYGSDSGFAFDYLRDHTFAMSPEQQICVQGQRFAIVDEVDAVLIDHARTPLILSSDDEVSSVDWVRVAKVVASLDLGVHVTVDRSERIAHLTDLGIDVVEAAFGIDSSSGDSLYSGAHAALARGVFHSLAAQYVFVEGVDYIVTGEGDDAEVSIIDATTGRVMADNVWSNGLHQAVEAHLGLRVRPETATLARISYQAYFRLYERVSGMSGTAITEADEFAKTFELTTVEIPTNRPLARIDAPDRVFSTAAAKLDAVAADVAAAHAEGRPVLIGAATVESSEEVSTRLTAAGVPHRLLNARTAEGEAEVIAAAGRPEAVTVSTAMAGRGTDILLGGDPSRLAAARIADADAEPGSPEAAAITAEVAERCAADAETVRSLGGLLVIGTERFEAQRVDLQLRGRAGRQGDPGESRFYVSAEDDMVAIFGAASQIISTIVSDSRPVSSRAISKMVERAQTTLEGRDAAARKSLLDWDAPLNGHRANYYATRDRWVHGDGTLGFVRSTVPDAVRRLLELNTADGELPVERFVAMCAFLSISAERAAELYDSDLAEALGALNTSGNIDALVEVLSGWLTELLDTAVASIGGYDDPEVATLTGQVLLMIGDRSWRDHMLHLDHLADAVKLRSPAGTPPMVVWVKEATEAFEEFSLIIAVDALAAALTLRPEPTAPTVGGVTLVDPADG